ncbi:hypothetical protein [Chromobacterium amazonense]|uniref:hypothetical protein n=1 Tax=Chromobacterium amazonense TaxID=1382803 RepID=UPI003F793867
MTLLFVWIMAAFFTYGFSAEPGVKPSIGQQLGKMFLALFIWPLLLGFALRAALANRA